ncbi:MAG: 2-dehydropantoate 2-reductase [Kofleriaceae bacterium]|nr:2-dehydropantoate 2-reductase [Kofleriaceae bacterium]MBP9172608.1 2-dehydropantoate 2-reductase [Kofleriaceae bacterium]MBP9861437.1 2-dehydropantoate 2-reductase [Kofleriaceae bacterium]
MTALPTAPRVLVVGAGGIGGIIAAHLAEAEVDVTAVTTNPTIRAAIESGAAEIVEDGEARPARFRAVAAPPADERFDVAILAVQPPQLEDAARTAALVLADGGVCVVTPNGLCEARVARLLGAERVIGAIVAWGASMPAPGRYERTAAGGFTVGRLAGPPDDPCRQVAALLEAVGPTATTDNLSGARWSKLALNCAISSLGTIAGERLGPLVRVRRYRRLALEIMTEVVLVARAERVRLEKVAGTLDLEWIALTEAERTAAGSPALAAKHALLLAVGLRYRKMRSSMLAAIERGRIPAVDFLNGEVVERGALHGVATPINRRVVELVHAIAAGRERSSRALLDRLFDESR